MYKIFNHLTAAHDHRGGCTYTTSGIIGPIKSPYDPGGACTARERSETIIGIIYKPYDRIVWSFFVIQFTFLSQTIIGEKSL